MPSAAAPALSTAAETAAVALPPSRALAFGPPMFSIASSTAFWLAASMPSRAGAMASFTALTARMTPLPRHFVPPS